MAPFKSVLAFAVVLAATLQPSVAIRVHVSKPTATADQEAPGLTSAASTNDDVAQPSTWPGFPSIPGLPQLPPLFPGFPPLLPLPSFLLPSLPSFPPLPPLPGCPPLLPIPGFVPAKPPHSGSPSSPGTRSTPPPASPPSSPSASPPSLQVGSPSPPATPPPPPLPSQPMECQSSLMGLMPCMGYLTNTSVQTPPTTCCDGFKSLVDIAPICLCHGMNGDINKLMPAHMDFMRMMSLRAFHY